MVHTVGETAPMTFTSWNFHGAHCGWNCTHDFYIVKLSWCTLWVKLHPRLLHRETFMVYTVGETSPTTFTSWNFHGAHCGWNFTHTFMVHTVGETAPMTFTLWNFHGAHCGWNFTHDFYIVKLSWRTLWVKLHPWLLHRETFMAHTVGETSPMTFTSWNFHGAHCGWNFTHDFYIVKLSWCTLWMKLHPWLLHHETFMVHTVGETSPMTFTSWNFHGVHCGWNFTLDFYIVKLSWCTVWVKLHPGLLHRETFLVHGVGETAPTTFTSWNFLGAHCGWNFTHDFNIVKFSWCWLCGNCFKQAFHQRTWFLVRRWREEIVIKLWNFYCCSSKISGVFFIYFLDEYVGSFSPKVYGEG